LSFQVLVVAGQESNNAPGTRVETFYPGKNCTQSLPNLPSAATNPAVCSSNGQIIVCINTFGVQCYTYSKQTNSWPTIGSPSNYDHDMEPFFCSGTKTCYLGAFMSECFDSVTLQWTSFAGRSNIVGTKSSVCLAGNGLLYNCAGMNSRGPILQNSISAE
jgi:hypothetical protein